MDTDKRFYPLASSIELREEGDQRTLIWISPPYDTWSPVRGDMQEMIVRDAFADSKDDVIATWEHDNSKIIGRQSAGTLRIEDLADGAHHAADLEPERTYDRDLMICVKRKEVIGASFEFVTMEDKWEKHQAEEDGPTIYRRTVLKARRIQGGPVARPFYGDESVALRSLEGWKAAHREGPIKGQSYDYYIRHLAVRKRRMALEGRV